ncbi:hypothetical protein L0P50_18645, partial [Lawsonibacter sp. DFI.6.74]|nr:hypothetical protein [Lawsonibacter sp. DFI.6.74]
NSLTERFKSLKNTRDAGQRRQIRSILSYKPVQELLERLASEAPKENQRICLPKATLEPIENRGFRRVVELL